MPTETLIPNAAGDSAQNTPVGAANNWDCCDDDNADTTYVRSITGDNEGIEWLDLYNLPATAIPIGAIITEFRIYQKVRSENPTYKATFMSCIKRGGTVRYADSGYSPGSSYTSYSNVITGIFQSDLDAIQIGIKTMSGYNPKLSICLPGRCTWLYVDITYHLPSRRLQVGVGV